ncbi:MAG: hypothetical protein GY699_06200 [Desulfobacteraceae bacterium]|nr:hypothetical protein [Desulfobacteraceae bacterium]
MKKNTANSLDHHCNVLEQKRLVSEMTECDDSMKDHKNKYNCYLKATKDSRDSKACLTS